MTDADDARLLQWARSYATAPSLAVTGGHVGFEGWSPERRSLAVAVEARSIEILVTPDVPCVNPVFEMVGATEGSPRVAIDGRPLAPGSWAWDGRTLWIDATIERPARIRIDFDRP